MKRASNHAPCAIDYDAAANYLELVEPFTARYARAAIAIAGNVAPGERLIDIGAGTGALTLAALAAGASVTAVDLSPAMIAKLRERDEARAAITEGRLTAEVMDGQALTLNDRSFDSAFSIFGIVLFPDWQQGLAEMARVVRPEGRGCVTVWTDQRGAGAIWPFWEALQRTLPNFEMTMPASGLSALCNADRLRAEMEQAGFAAVSIDQVYEPWRAPSADWIVERLDSLYGQMPLFRALSPADRDRFEEHMRRALEPWSEDQAIVIPTMAHVAAGRR